MFAADGQGSFRGGENATPFVGNKGQLHFEPETRIETDSDKSMIVVYNETKKEVVYLTNGEQRIEDGYMLAVPDSFSGDTVHGFLAFITADGSRVSTSIYAGSTTVA